MKKYTDLSQDGSSTLKEILDSLGDDTVSAEISDRFLFGQDIPDSIGRLQKLRSLNVSSNYLTGTIPTTLGRLLYLETLNLANNKLSKRKKSLF